MTDPPHFPLGIYCVLLRFFQIFKTLKILVIFFLCFINSDSFTAGLLSSDRLKSMLHTGRRFCFLEVLIPAMKSNLCSTGDLVVSEQ